jgi:hypothetical protein
MLKPTNTYFQQTLSTSKIMPFHRTQLLALTVS